MESLFLETVNQFRKSGPAMHQSQSLRTRAGREPDNPALASSHKLQQSERTQLAQLCTRVRV